MARIYSKRIPTNFSDALNMCKDYAKARKNKGVERIADEMGISASRLYQYLDNGDLPLHRLRNFQNICGCNYVTQYLAQGDNSIVVQIPTGKKMADDTLLEMQSNFSAMMTQLLEFYRTNAKGDPKEIMAEINSHIANVAWHRENVGKAIQPDLDFEGSD